MEYPYQQPSGGEEPLNRQVAGHLYYSLQFGPELINTSLANLPVTFSDVASIIGGQDDPLPNAPDNEISREIDWVVRDRDKLVGFESKYGSSLKKSQLEDELTKLRANADGDEVYLITITDHATQPELLSEFDEQPVYWTNWSSVASQLAWIDESELSPEQYVPLRMLQDLFEVEDMEPFQGFNHRDKSQYRRFIRDLQPEVRTLSLEHRGKLHNWTQDKSDPSGYARIVPKYISIPFVHEDRPPHNQNGRPQSKRASVFVVIVDTETHRTYAGIVFGIRKVRAHRQMLREHGKAIADECGAEGYELWIAPHSINHRTTPLEKATNIENMKKWLSRSGKRLLADPEVDNTYKKAWFVRECRGPDPEELFSSIVDTLADQKRRFLEQDAYLEPSSLADPEIV